MKIKRDIRIRHAAIVLLVCVLAFIIARNGYAIDPELQEEHSREGLNSGIQAVLSDYRQRIPKMMAECEIPGLSVAIVDRDGILWTAGFGHTDFDQEMPVTPDTLFFICSMSKTFTATAVMCAVQDGLIELDEPIITYVPDFKVNSRFEDNPQNKITLRHLLNHTSGLAHEAPVGNAREPSHATLEEHIKSISDTWLRQSLRREGRRGDEVPFSLRVSHRDHERPPDLDG
jgi:CubicO group peptidase (beta-lactamase class C family)